MKATEVIQQYRNGQRNFQRLNLRGVNFKGQDLSGADFSYCRIQSANFSKANLTNTKFIGAKAGLQKRWVIILLFLALVLIAISSCFTVFVGFLSAEIFNPDPVTRIAGIVTLIIILLFCYFSYRKSLLRILLLALFFVVTGVVTTIFFALLLFIILAIAGEGTTGAIGFALPAIGGMASFAIILAYIAVLGLAGATVIVGAILGDRAIFVSYAIGGIVAFLGGFSVKGVFGGIVSLLLAIFTSFIGYRTLKDETRDPWLRRIAIYFAAIGGTSFYKANLTDADLTGTNFKNTNFNKATLTRTCFKNTIKLNLARPGNTLLANFKVRDLLMNPSSGEGQNFGKADLRGANLTEANLKKANLRQADISEATFKYANLSDANLTEVNAVGTDFTKAYLTDACLENWNIDATTKLHDVDCQYVYLLNDKKERRPSSGDFKPGEFTKLFEEVFDTVDLIFENGIDWKAFIETIKTVQVQNEDTPLEVASIENKGDGVFVVKVKVPPDANKEKIHQQLEENYQLKLEAMETKYKAELNAKDSQIESFQRESANMKNIAEVLANRPINVEVNNMNNSSDTSKNINIRDINNSGVLNLGEIIGDVNNTINQISENQDNQSTELKRLLQELTTAIDSESENTLDDDEKGEAANQVKKIAEAVQNPDNESLQNKAKRAVSFLEIIAKGLEPASKLAKACKAALPVIISFLGF